MSHQSSGYFYYEYTYTPDYHYRPGAEPRADEAGRDGAALNPFRTAYHTRHRQDHRAQADWYRSRVRPQIEADCSKFIDLYNATDLHKYPREHGRKPNRFGRVYSPFDWARVTEVEFCWKPSPPLTREGRDRLTPYGKEI